MIKYNLKLTRVESNPSLIQHLEDRLSQISKFVHSDIENAFSEVELGKTTEHHRQGEIFKAEVNLKLADGSFFRADATSGDLFSALDDVKTKISKEVKRHYKKENTLLKRGGRAIKNILRGFQ